MRHLMLSQSVALLASVVSAAPQCDGTLSTNGRACCPISCGGSCGGDICADDAPTPLGPEAKARCCTDVLLTVAPPCTENGGAPCTMPATLSKGQKACTSGLDNDLPYEACMSYCSADSLAAHCAKCKCKSCNMCQGLHPPMHPIAKPPPPPYVFAHTSTKARETYFMPQ